MATTSPTLRHRVLVRALRQHREEAGHGQAEAAERMGWSESKQLKLETGKIPVKVSDVRGLLQFYGVADQETVEELVQLARDARQQGWWAIYGDAVPNWFENYIGLETEATSLRCYQAELVHGLLQTPEYYRSVISAAIPASTEEEVQRKIEIRSKRQARLEGEGALEYWAILNEAVLRRSPGRDVLKQQLQHILDRMELPNVTVQVLPFDAGMHPAMDTPFEIMGFPESADLDVLYLESGPATTLHEDKDLVSQYNAVYDHLRSMALDSSKSHTVITQILREVS